jgi:hypothetical protein
MDKALFITETDLKNGTFINENVSMVKLRPLVMMCQEMQIQPIIGSDLYNEIDQQIIDGNLSNENQTLLFEYIQPALKMWVMAESPMILSFRYVNKNVERGQSENNTMASMSELQKQMDYFKNKAQWYSERLTRYIIANVSDYPLYNANNSIDDIIPSRENYNTGLVLDDCWTKQTFEQRFQGENGCNC